MSFEEKWTWIFGTLTVAVYGVYAAIVLSRADGSPLADVAYESTLLWSVGAAIALGIVLRIVLSIASPEGANGPDVRDKEIERIGEHIGRWFVFIGAVAAIGMALAELEHFWIANTIYLAFVLSAVLSSVAKVVANRRGFQSW